MQINYILTQAAKDKLAAANPGALDQMRLLYHYTQGIVKLCYEDEALELHVPVFDFAWCLLHIVKKLQTEDSTLFQFTESADVVTFRSLAEMVLITTDFSEWQCQLPYHHLRIAVVDFAQAVVDDLCASVPELRANPTIKEAYKKLAGSGVQEQDKDTSE